MREREAANATALAGTHQDVAFGSQVRLHDRIALPWVLPEQRSVSERDAGRAGAAQQKDLLNSVDGQETRRAVARAAGRAQPARSAADAVVGDESAGDANDDEVAGH